MKTKQWFLIVAALSISLCLPAIAGTGMSYPHGYSRSAVISWAFENTQQVQVSIFGDVEYDSSTGEGCTWLYREQTDLDCSKIFESIASMEFDPIVIRPEAAQVGFYAFFDDILGGETMYGGQYVRLEQDSLGTWVFPKSLLKVQLKLAENIRVPILVDGNITNANIKVRDDNGNVVAWTYLEVGVTGDGVSWVSLPTALLDKDGDLQTWSEGYDSNGKFFSKTSSFDLHSVEKIGTSIPMSGFQVGVDGYVKHNDNDQWWYEWVNTQGTNIGQGSLHKVTLTKELAVYMYANTDVGEWSKQVHYRRIDVGSPNTDWQDIPLNDWIMQTLEPGDYQFYFDWDQMKAPGPDSVPFPYYGDYTGKG